MQAHYRFKQFLRGLRARKLSGNQVEEVAEVLSPSELNLFRQQSLNDQLHGYLVMDALRRAGHVHKQLLAAALLHDVGKALAPLSVWERSIVVLVETFLPRKAKAWGMGLAQGWKRPLVVKAQHAEWGARLAEAAGSHPTTVALIGRHQDGGTDDLENQKIALLRCLQWADDHN